MKEMRPIHLEVNNEDSAKDRIASHEQPALSTPQPQSQLRPNQMIDS